MVIIVLSNRKKTHQVYPENLNKKYFCPHLHLFITPLPLQTTQIRNSVICEEQAALNWFPTHIQLKI